MAVNVMIMAGGAGVRFWPRSRRRRPKQLLDIVGKRSMLQQTVVRVLPLEPASLMVVTNALQADEADAQLCTLLDCDGTDAAPDCGAQVVVEPRPRNTAPAIALAAGLLLRTDPDGSMIVLPADHHIRDEETFRARLQRALEAAESGALVTLGIQPTRPETGYGYIEVGDEVAPDVRRVRQFREKPNRATAEEYLASGRFLWNSGMFVWRLDALLGALQQHMPALYALARGIADAPADTVEDLIAEAFVELDGESIDFGVMEKHEDVVVVPADMGWNDVGSWTSVAELTPQDDAGNATDGNVLTVDSENCFVQATSRTVAVVGARDLVVVETPDAVLVCTKAEAQRVRDVVKLLEKRGSQELL